MAKTMAAAGDAPKRRSYADMSVRKVSPSGAYEFSSMVDGHLHSRQFQGYSKKEAMKKYYDDRQQKQGK